jgi:hypothetical protein
MDIITTASEIITEKNTAYSYLIGLFIFLILITIVFSKYHLDEKIKIDLPRIPKFYFKFV